MTYLERKQKLKDEIEYLSNAEQLQLYNDYATANHYEMVYQLTDDELTSFCGDSLTTYFEQIEHSSHFDMDDEYFTIDGNGWIKSFDDIEDLVTEDAVLDYVLDNYDEFEGYFDEDIFEEEEE